MNKSSKKGFTLMEMMLVVAIILLIAGMTVYGVKDYLDKANSWKREVEEHGDMYDRCQSDVDGYLVGFTREILVAVETLAVVEHLTLAHLVRLNLVAVEQIQLRLVTQLNRLNRMKDRRMLLVPAIHTVITRRIIGVVR